MYAEERLKAEIRQEIIEGKYWSHLNDRDGSGRRQKTRRWPLKITLPLLAPIALTLTNGSFFAMLLSFGLFWIFVFLLSRFTFRS